MPFHPQQNYSDGPPGIFAAALLLFVLSFGHAQNASAQDAGRFLDWSYQDGAALMGELRPNAPLLVASGAALLLPGPSLDMPILEGIQRHNRGAFEDYLQLTNGLGGPKVVPVAAGIFGASLLTDNEKFQDAAFTSLQSIVYSGASVYALKYTFGRFRPEEGLGAREFNMFSKNTSFPSGHTATAVALVTPWVLYYPGPASYALMALPAGTAIARIAKDRHWPTDVIAGASIGFLTAKFLSERHQGSSPAAKPPRIEITPGVAPGAVSLNLKVRLE